jgi:hypothetical protein
MQKDSIKNKLNCYKNYFRRIQIIRLSVRIGMIRLGKNLGWKNNARPGFQVRLSKAMSA